MKNLVIAILVFSAFICEGKDHICDLELKFSRGAFNLVPAVLRILDNLGLSTGLITHYRRYLVDIAKYVSIARAG